MNAIAQSDMHPETHVSLASGGAYLVLYSSFWKTMDSLPSGERFRSEITSVSGSSAGALIGSALAHRVPGHTIHSYAISSGVTDRFYYLRALAVYFKLRKSLYGSKRYVQKLTSLLQTSTSTALPFTAAVTDSSLHQQCVQLTSCGKDVIANAAMASAAVPFVFEPRPVKPFGLCSDGSCAINVFPCQTVVHALQNNTGRLVVLNCSPWPGHREQMNQDSSSPGFLSVQRLLTNYDAQLYDHGMERTFDFNIKPSMTYQDGIFDLRVDNSTGNAVVSPTGNLHVIFVAPTAHQFALCGGAHSKTNVHYKPSDKTVKAMVKVGNEMAVEFLSRYGSITF